MILANLTLQNFRSYRDLSLDLSKGLSTCVGENNVGKSSLISALQMIRKLDQADSIDVEDWTDADPSKPIAIEVTVELNDNELQVLAMKTAVGTAKSFKETYGEHLRIRLESTVPGQKPQVYVSVLLLTKSGTLSPRAQIGGFSLQPRSELRRLDTSAEVRQIIQDGLILFPEYRVRPQRIASTTLTSPDGTEVAPLLLNLKVGSRPLRLLYQTIQSQFSELFPGLSLDVMSERITGPNNVTVTRSVIAVGKSRQGNSSETTLERIGSGIADMIVLLAHIVGSQNRFIGIDEPELHLHPHTQRLLAQLLQASSNRNQILTLTHSSQFVDLRDPTRIILLRNTAGPTSVSVVKAGTFDTEDQAKLAKTSSDDKDFLFSRRVLMVEGDTEIGAMPVFARKLGKDFDVNGVSVMNIGGSHFALHLKLVSSFRFPYVVMSDRDALMRIQETIKLETNDVRTSRVLSELSKAGMLTDKEKVTIRGYETMTTSSQTGDNLPEYDAKLWDPLKTIAQMHSVQVLSSDFEGVLAAAGYSKLFDEARTQVGKSKALQGRYVAERIRNIPNEIGSIINKVTLLT